MTDNCDVKIVLNSAIEHLENRGWCRNMLFNYSTGAACSMGAVIKAVDLVFPDRRGSERDVLKDQAFAVLGEQIRAWCDHNGRTTPMRDSGSGRVNIAAWNDGMAADKRTVIRVFKKAAASVECPQ